MSNRKKREKAIARLETVGSSTEVALIFADGHAEYPCRIYDVSRYDGKECGIFYARSPFEGWETSKIYPRDMMPFVPLRRLGFVLTEDGRKISLVPFHY